MNEKKKNLEFYMGDTGAVLPLVVMLGGIILLVLADLKNAKNYWSAAFLGLIVAYSLMKEKKQFNGVMLRAIGDKMFASLMMTWIFAGIFAKSLSIGGLANGVLWAAQQIGVGPTFLPVMLFLVACGLSTAMGTCGGTISVMIPVFLPTAVALGCHPLVIAGAIMSGSYFGDNLAPISDTTIASAGTMGVDVASCVRTRLRYSLTAGSITAVIFVLLGIMLKGDMTLAVAGVVESDPRHLILLIPAILLIVMVIKTGDLVPCLLLSAVLSMTLSIVFGLVLPADIFAVDGIIAAGTESMMGIMIFSFLTFCIIQCTTESGVLDRITMKISSICRSPRSCEFTIIILCVIITIMVPSNSVAIILCGPIAAKLIREQKLEPTRGSNLLDGICVSVTSLLFYSAGVLMCYSLSMESGVVAADISPAEMVLYSPYGACLIIVLCVSAFTGWGRKYISTEEKKHIEEGYEMV